MPNLSQTLEALAGQGVVLPTEIRAAVDVSLPLKRVDAGLVELGLWGRLRTSSGKDYYVAVGHRTVPYFFEQKLVEDRKVFVSQDGFSWVDLPSPSQIPYEKAAAASGIKMWLTGDMSFVNSVSDELAATPEAGDDVEPSPPVEVTEIERISVIVSEVAASTRILPAGYAILNANNELVPNKMYAGLLFPESLESYTHYAGPALITDLPGMWALTYDAFKQISCIRHTEWPGFVFFYSNAVKDYGSFYVGSGVKNTDVLFML